MFWPAGPAPKELFASDPHALSRCRRFCRSSRAEKDEGLRRSRVRVRE